MATELPTLEEIRQRAARHDLELGRHEYLTVQDLHVRWRRSATAIRAIPITELPFLDLGQGHQKVVRRYLPSDVEAYELRRYRRAG